MKINLSIKNNAENYIVIFSFFCFIFGWGIKYDYFQLRFFIFLPLIFIFYNTLKSKNYNYLKFPFYFFLFLAFHYLISSFFLGVFYIKTFIFILITTLLAIVISYYKNFISKQFHLVIKFFLFLFIPIFFINLIYGFYLFSLDDNLTFGRLLFNCDNSLISYARIFFDENSHVGMVGVAVLFSLIFLNKKYFDNSLKAVSIFFFIICFMFYSTTLLVGIIASSFFISIYCIKEKLYRELKVILGILAVTLIFSQSNTCSLKIAQTIEIISTNKQLIIEENEKLKNIKKKEVIERITRGKSGSFNIPSYLSSKSKNDEPDIREYYYTYNLSTNVVFYSILLASYSVKDKIFGYGINNYSIAYNEYMDDLSWYHVAHPWLNLMNRLDGANNTSKLIVEFGIVSFLLIPIFLLFLFSSRVSLFSKFFFISLILTQLLRGAGYFNGGFVFAIIYMILITLNKDEDKKS